MKRIFFLLSTVALLTLTTPGSASKAVTGSKTPINPATMITPSTPTTSRPMFRRSHYQEQQ